MGLFGNNTPKAIKKAKLLGMRTAETTKVGFLMNVNVNFTVYSFYVEYVDGSTTTIEVAPNNPDDKKGKGKALYNQLIAIANEEPADNEVRQRTTTNEDSTNALDELKKLKELYDAGVIPEDIYEMRRDALCVSMMQGSSSEAAPQKAVQYNCVIQRQNTRKSGEAKTYVIIDGEKRKDIDCDMRVSLTLSSGMHTIEFQRAAVTSKQKEIVISGSNVVNVYYTPKTLSIDIAIG